LHILFLFLIEIFIFVQTAQFISGIFVGFLT